MTSSQKDLIALKNGFLRNPFNFHGRASRREFFGVSVVILLINKVLDHFYEPTIPIFIAIVFWGLEFFLFMQHWRVTARRFHDIGLSGWWTVLVFLPVLTLGVALPSKAYVLTLVSLLLLIFLGFFKQLF